MDEIKRIQGFTGHHAGCAAVFGGDFAGYDDKTNPLRRGVRAAKTGEIRAVANRFGVEDEQIGVHARADARRGLAASCGLSAVCSAVCAFARGLRGAAFAACVSPSAVGLALLRGAGQRRGARLPFWPFWELELPL